MGGEVFFTHIWGYYVNSGLGGQFTCKLSPSEGVVDNWMRAWTTAHHPGELPFTEEELVAAVRLRDLEVDRIRDVQATNKTLEGGVSGLSTLKAPVNKDSVAEIALDYGVCAEGSDQGTS